MAEKNPIVTLEVADYEPIKIELYPEIAPNTVNNFISLVNQGFYNGLTFHRIIKGFMIQGRMSGRKWYRRTRLQHQRGILRKWL